MIKIEEDENGSLVVNVKSLSLNNVINKMTRFSFACKAFFGETITRGKSSLFLVLPL